MTTDQVPKHWLDLSPESVIRTAWQGRIRLLLITVVFAGIGIVVALLTQPEYVSGAKIMPEMNNGSGDMFKRLASVAGFAGLDMSETEGVDAIRPDLYPNVLQSTPFVLYLLGRPVVTTDGEPTTVANLLMSDDAWWPLNWFRSGKKDDQRIAKQTAGKPVQLTKQQEKLVDDISKRVGAKLDTRSGVITIAAKMPDASVAAAVAQLSMDYLTQYVTSYRTEKARHDLQFYAQRLNEARQRYQTAQFNVFHYNDQHKYFVVQAATMEKQRMEAELTIAQTVYTELSRQFEQARLNVQERTPIFNVLDPVQVPSTRVSPKRALMVVFYAVAGFVLGMIYLIAQRADLIGRVRTMVSS